MLKKDSDITTGQDADIWKNIRFRVIVSFLWPAEETLAFCGVILIWVVVVGMMLFLFTKVDVSKSKPGLIIIVVLFVIQLLFLRALLEEGKDFLKQYRLFKKVMVISVKQGMIDGMDRDYHTFRFSRASDGLVIGEQYLLPKHKIYPLTYGNIRSVELRISRSRNVYYSLKFDAVWNGKAIRLEIPVRGLGFNPIVRKWSPLMNKIQEHNPEFRHNLYER